MTTVVQTNEEGDLILSPELLGTLKAHTKYTVEAMGTKLILEPEEQVIQRQKTYEEWERDWDTVTEQISAAWNTNQSAAEIVSEMRR